MDVPGIHFRQLIPAGEVPVTPARPPRLLLGAAAVTTVLFAVACGSPSKSTSAVLSPPASSSAAASAQPEKAHITVGTLPIVDAADLFIAINKEYFHRAGLTVTPEIIQATSQTTPDLVSGKMDFPCSIMYRRWKSSRTAILDLSTLLRARSRRPTCQKSWSPRAPRSLPWLTSKARRSVR